MLSNLPESKVRTVSPTKIALAEFERLIELKTINDLFVTKLIAPETDVFAKISSNIFLYLQF